MFSGSIVRLPVLGSFLQIVSYKITKSLTFTRDNPIFPEELEWMEQSRIVSEYECLYLMRTSVETRTYIMNNDEIKTCDCEIYSFLLLPIDTYSPKTV